MPTFITPEPVSATIDLPLGDVRVTASDRQDTIVDVRPSDASDADDRKAAELTRIDYGDGQLVVKAPKLRSWLSRRGGGSIDVTVDLPAGSSLHGVGGAADFDCEGRLGDCRVKTGLGSIRIDDGATLNLKSGSGDITVEHARGDTDITTGSGDVRLNAAEGATVVKNSNGDTWIGRAEGDLRLNAANGRITVDHAGSGVVAKTANGDVRLGEAVRGTAVLKTHMGDLEVGIREGTAAWLDVNTSAGRVHNALEAADAPGSAGDTIKVHARTSLGDIAIHRA